MKIRKRKDILRKYADLNRPLIFDGAMGSLLQQQGVPDNENLWTIKANIDSRKTVLEAHKKYIEAGSEIITTNTFRTNPLAVESSELLLSSEEFVKASVDIVLEAAGNREVLVAGSNPPAEDSYQVERTVGYQSLEENHHRHIKALQVNGVDFILNETQSHLDEIEIICKHCYNNDIPYIISLFVTEELKILSGEELEEVLSFIKDYHPIAVGINCIYPDIMLKIIESHNFLNKWGFYLNCGSGAYTDNKIECGISPELYLDYVKKLLPYNPLFIGACCGSNPEHIKYIRNYLDESIEIKAPAKINIGLYIIEKRNDGFHNLETFFYPIHDLYDIITIKKADNFKFQCDWADLNNDDNLVVKAVKLLEKKTGKKFPVEISLGKTIPFGGGMGGGSSDAAAVLVSLNEMFNLKFDFEQLKDLALLLGSDVPFFLFAKPAIGKARGENLELINYEINKPILLINPGIEIPTKEAFGNITPRSPDISLKEVLLENKSSLCELQNLLRNDFEKYVFSKYPDIEDIKNTMLREGAELSMMSGSGSTVFGIFSNGNAAENCKQKISGNYFKFLNYPQAF